MVLVWVLAMINTRKGCKGHYSDLGDKREQDMVIKIVKQRVIRNRLEENGWKGGPPMTRYVAGTGSRSSHVIIESWDIIASDMKKRKRVLIGSSRLHMGKGGKSHQLLKYEETLTYIRGCENTTSLNGHLGWVYSTQK